MSVMVRASAIIRDEMLWAWTLPESRERANRAIFGHARTYYPGGSTFERGLFDWERAAITSPPFPPSGRILLGGAGAGRELAGLCKMGYKVLAFEPSAALAEAAVAVAAPYPESKVICASYRDSCPGRGEGIRPACTPCLPRGVRRSHSGLDQHLLRVET